MNHLQNEKSPYLIQHAENPVDWYPWGPEAIQKAKSENKPIFLSIGYSTCHWCHVMEDESFTNLEIAKYLNEHFISIKVDREERPDLDHLYMQAVMAMTGQGGWPMSVFLTPDMEPFYGGTYFPPEDRWGRPGFRTLLKAIEEKWRTETDHIIDSARSMTEALREEAKISFSENMALGAQTLDHAFSQFESRFDAEFGGFSAGGGSAFDGGRAPKFPSGHNLSFLLRYWKRTGNERALYMVEKTLSEMKKGGIHDFLGGGFHRYSTDKQWRVPHFEKMLYDEAMLARVYLEAYAATKKEVYAETARGIFEYVLRDLTSKEGAFFSAEDADSLDSKLGHKKEGAFYVWSQREILEALGEKEGADFCRLLGVEPRGNAPQWLDKLAIPSEVEGDPQGEFQGLNVLYEAQEPLEGGWLRKAKRELFEIRGRRPRPHLDDKVLTDWNGLMIGALALGARLLNEPHYEAAARRAADFILDKMMKQGRLYHRHRDGEVAIPGFLEDYAFLGDGFLELYQATLDERYSEKASFLAGEMLRLFWDDKEGGFFVTGSDAEALIARPKSDYDGALPSGNSMAAYFLARLGRMAAEKKWEIKAKETLRSISGKISAAPSAYTQMLAVLDFEIGPGREVALEGDLRDPTVSEMRRVVSAGYSPNTLLSHRVGEGAAKAYVCVGSTCKPPVTDPEKLKGMLE